MRFSRSVPRRSRATSFGILWLLAAVAACDGDRLRPGPPELLLTGPEAGTVFSPDTIIIGIHAADANGLDSVVVSYLGQVTTISAFAQAEIDDFTFFFIPEGLAPSQQVVINGTAADLTGQTTVEMLNLTVVVRP